MNNLQNKNSIVLGVKITKEFVEAVVKKTDLTDLIKDLERDEKLNFKEQQKLKKELGIVNSKRYYRNTQIDFLKIDFERNCEKIKKQTDVLTDLNIEAIELKKMIKVLQNSDGNLYIQRSLVIGIKNTRIEGNEYFLATELPFGNDCYKRGGVNVNSGIIDFDGECFNKE